MINHKIYGVLDVSYMNLLSIREEVSKYRIKISRGKDTFSLVIHATLYPIIPRKVPKEKK